MEFKIGDRVRIRQWEDMEKEFGTDLCGDIVMKGYWHFAKGMRHLCGREAVITEICDQRVELDFDSKTGDMDWNYTTDIIEKVEDTKMTKKDLENGMVVETRGGDRHLVIEKSGVINFMNLDGKTYFDEKHMKDDMTFPEWCDHCDIMKVFPGDITLDGCRETTDLIWERKEPKEMTVAEIEKALGYPVKVVK